MYRGKDEGIFCEKKTGKFLEPIDPGNPFDGIVIVEKDEFMPKDGLVGHWSFNEMTDKIVPNLGDGGPSMNGQLVGNGSLEKDVGDGKKIRKSVLRLEENGAIRIRPPKELAFGENKTPFTIACWLRTTERDQVLWSRGNDIQVAKVRMPSDSEVVIANVATAYESERVVSD